VAGHVSIKYQKTCINIVLPIQEGFAKPSSISRRDFEFLMMKYPTAKGGAGEPGTSELEALKKNLDELDRASPTIPDKIYDVAAAKTPLPQ